MTWPIHTPQRGVGLRDCYLRASSPPLLNLGS